MRDFMIVGLTGPTGAGKSTVSHVFREAGFRVINADEVARSVMQPGSVCAQQLAIAFGSDIILEDGNINRRLLAGRAFSSPENTWLLSEITHPGIFLKTLAMCRSFIDSGDKRIVFDAPVLFESNSDLMCDSVVCVTAPREVRAQRLMKRDNLTREEIERRISAQQPDEFYMQRSDFTIDGGAELEEVKESVRKVIAQMM